MTTIQRILATAFALLFFTAAASAQNQVRITGVSVGLPVAGTPAVETSEHGIAKFGTWAPVYVSIEVLAELNEPAELLFETADADEVTTTLKLPLDIAATTHGTTIFAPDLGTIGYIRPSGTTSEVTVTVRTRSGTPISAPYRVRIRPREPLQYLVLSLGGAPAGFELPKPSTGGSDAGTLRAGRVELAHLNSLAALPDQWFGYDAADLILINTGTASEEFLTSLFNSESEFARRKREALIEWVLRGGRVVISVGEKAELVGTLRHLQPLLPNLIWPASASRHTDAVSLYWSASQTGSANIVSGSLGTRGGAPFALANLYPRPDRSTRIVIPPPARHTDKMQPIAAQSAYGLGRVTVIGFDLDRAPFADFPQHAEFWDWVLRECGANRASAGGDGKPRLPGILTEEENEAAVAIRIHNDTFEGIPVVSFGWIAVLIVLYMLLIGPIEYYLLRRILGRLELTWLTFPIIVFTVCVVVYFSAEATKSRELRINKIDLVDVDPAWGRITGTTWFTVFSPKIDTYTIGIEPGDGWSSDHGYGTVVVSQGAPRGGRPGLIRRKYEIHSEHSAIADRLENVPIQVWSTKAFSANWSYMQDTSTVSPPEYSAKSKVYAALRHPPGDRTKVLGTFIHNLPVPALVDCVAFYAGQAYPLPGNVIVRGQPVRMVLDHGIPASQWLQTHGQLESLLNRVQSYAERPGQKPSARQQELSGPLPLWGMLFHEGSLRNEEGVFARNASLRRLDQSWRLAPENHDEIIIVGRTRAEFGPADEVLTGPHAPSKIWLKGKPESGERWSIPGQARQETWVRFYLPVR